MVDLELMQHAMTCCELEKQSFIGETLVGGSLGAGVGALRAPSGKRLEGAGYGTVRGLGAGLGTGLGGFAGMLAGGLGGAAIGLPITSAIQGMPTETKAQLLAALVGTGMIGGGLALAPKGTRL